MSDQRRAQLWPAFFRAKADGSHDAASRSAPQRSAQFTLSTTTANADYRVRIKWRRGGLGMAIEQSLGPDAC